MIFYYLFCKLPWQLQTYPVEEVGMQLPPFWQGDEAHKPTTLKKLKQKKSKQMFKFNLY